MDKEDMTETLLSLLEPATTEKKFEKLTGFKYRNVEEFANG